MWDSFPRAETAMPLFFCSPILNGPWYQGAIWMVRDWVELPPGVVAVRLAVKLPLVVGVPVMRRVVALKVLS